MDLKEALLTLSMLSVFWRNRRATGVKFPDLCLMYLH